MAVTDKFLGFKIKEIMSPSLIHFHEEQSLDEVIEIFLEKHISGAPVKDSSDCYVGVLSKTDLLKKEVITSFKERNNDMTVADIMKRSSLVTIDEDKAVEEAAEIMLHHKIHRIFVTGNHGSIVGVLSSYDVMKVLATFSEISAIEKSLNVKF